MTNSHNRQGEKRWLAPARKRVVCDGPKRRTPRKAEPRDFLCATCGGLGWFVIRCSDDIYREKRCLNCPDPAIVKIMMGA